MGFVLILCLCIILLMYFLFLNIFSFCFCLPVCFLKIEKQKERVCVEAGAEMFRQPWVFDHKELGKHCSLHLCLML